MSFPVAVQTAAPPSDIPARRVMVVDDSRVQRKILTTQLTRAGYHVVEAGSVEEALPACAEAAPDIVISDWVMPGMSGLDFCRALRAQGHENYIYFILLTSKTEAAEVALGLDGGADDFLTKPVTGDELRARIAAGDRIIRMERELTDKNRLLTDTLSELRVIHEAMNRDLLEARKLQQSLVRERFRRFGTMQISLLLQPSGHIGGDLVGFFPIGGGKVGVYSLDVSGHGITSALMTARLAGFLSGGSPEQNIALVPGTDGYQGRDPAEVAAHLNRIVLDEMRTESYFTLAYAEIDLATGLARLVQAGHPHPALQRASGAVEYLGRGGLPVGLFSEAAYETVEVRLHPGDRLLLISDGATEVETSGGEQLAEEGLAKILTRLKACSGPDFMDAFVEELERYAGSDFADDVSGALIEML